MSKSKEKFDTVALAVEPMSLKFFSYRFMIRKKYLRYGIVAKTNQVTYETELIPALLIKGVELFINILEDRLEHNISDSQYVFKEFECEFLLSKTHYIFRHGEMEELLGKRFMKEFYLNKVFSWETKKMMGATPDDFK